MIGYDIDGVLLCGTSLSIPQDCDVVISGRTFAEYDLFCKMIAIERPLYIRGAGEHGDRIAAGKFKALMINHLGVATFYENDSVQINEIRRACPHVEIVKVNRCPK